MLFRRGLHPAFAPALALLLAPACSGQTSDDTVDPTTTTLPPSTSTGPDDGTGTGPVDPTSGGQDDTSTSDPPSTGDPTTTAPTLPPSTDPSTTDVGADTGDTTAAATSTATTDATTDTGADTTTGGFDPAHIPEIPDDGMPSSAHFKKVPLGDSDALQGYWEYTPPGYGGGDLYPLLVFLHGIGENGNGVEDLDKVPATGIPALMKNDQWPTDRPFVVLSPQHPGGGCPNAQEVHDFITFATASYDINPSRVYLTGLSCGAIGSWNYLQQHTDEQIVAMVPIAGDGKGAFNAKGCELGRVPLWAFHGDADDVVNESGTIEPITKLQMCNPKPEAEMVIYPGVGHDSWTMTYDLSAGHDIYAWLLAHVKP